MQSLSVQPGETFRIAVRLWEGAIDGSDPFDLTGGTVETTQRKPGSIPAPAIEYIERTEGRVQFTWTAAQTADFRRGSYFSFRIKTTLANGDVHISPDVGVSVE